MLRIIIAVMTVLVMYAPAQAGKSGEDFGVYVKAIERASSSFDETVSALEAGLTASGFEVLASFNAGVDKDCGKLRAHVVVFNDKAYMEKIMSHGPTAAFALPLRAAVYEDEKGVHVEYVNPSSINRTVLGDKVELALSAEMSTAINNAITSSVKGSAVARQIGEIRDEGYVGGMGGGKFYKKIVTFNKGRKYTRGGTLESVTAAVDKGIKGNTDGWNLYYKIEAAEGVTLFGMSKTSTEATAFNIAGDSREEKKFVCPGLDHAAAFPIEVIVYTRQGKKGKENVVISLDEMYRMKVYFEDAGSWAFAKNMSMPGDIEDEIKAVVTKYLRKK